MLGKRAPVLYIELCETSGVGTRVFVRSLLILAICKEISSLASITNGVNGELTLLISTVHVIFMKVPRGSSNISAELWGGGFG